MLTAKFKWDYAIPYNLAKIMELARGPMELTSVIALSDLRDPLAKNVRNRLLDFFFFFL